MHYYYTFYKIVLIYIEMAGSEVQSTTFCKSLANNVEYLLNSEPKQKLNFLRKKQAILQKSVII